MKTQKKKHLHVAACAAILTTALAQAQTVLFRDEFTRANNSDINASTAGQSGILSPLVWGIKTVVGTAAISSNQLRLDATDTDGNSGAYVYPDQNFIGLTGLTVTMDITAGASSGDGRSTGFGIGYTKAALDGKTSVSNANQWTGAEVYIGFDNIGTTKSVFVRENGTNVFSKAIPSPAYPAKYTIVFTFADMNDGTTINYEVFENDISVHTNSTTWAGTDQNYVAFASNYTTNCDINFIEIAGTIPPPPTIVKANNIFDLNLGTSWVGGNAPVSGNLAKWDITVDNTNTSTLLGADVTWGGIIVQDPGGPVTIGGANTLSLDGLGKAVDLSTAGPDLTVNANLTLAGGNVWDVGASRTVTAGGVVSGSSGIDKQGDGTVILSGANTYAGATTVTAGTLKLGAADVIPNGIGAGNLSVAGTLNLNGNSDTVNGLSGGGVIDNATDSTVATLIAGDNNQSGTFAGILQDSGTSATLNFEKTGTGTIELQSANTLSGSVSLTGGKLAFSNANPFASASGISLANGTTLEPRVDGGTLSSPITLTGGSGIINAPAIGNTNAVYTLNLNSQISGPGGLTLFGIQGGNTRGTIILGAANTYAGNTLIDATIFSEAQPLNNTNVFVELGAVNALPTTTVLTIDGQIGDGSGRTCQVDLKGFNQTLAGLTNITRTGRNQRIVNSSGTAVTLTVDQTADYTFSGNLGFSTNNNFGLTKDGVGIFTLSGTNNYSGQTNIIEGELRLGEGGAGGVLSPTGDIVVASGATFGVNQSDTVVQGTDFSGNPITGDGNFAKLGAGSTTLNAANAYNGTTTVNGGTLVVAHASALGSTAAGTVVNGTNTSNAANAKLELSGGVTVTGESLTISGTGNFIGALTSSGGSNVWAGPVTIGLANTRLGASAGASLEVNGVIDSGVPNTGLVIRCTDMTSSVILSGANTYSGSTTVSVGKLKLDGGDNRLPIGTTLALNSGTTTEAEFDLNGRNQQVAGLNQTNDVTKNSVNNSSLTPSTLTVDTAATFVYGGILKGNLAITKAGSGTLTLSGTTNSHSGNTTVNQGILSIGGINTGVSNDASTVTIAASGATLNLTYIGTDTVDKLFIGATQKAAGVYGALNSGAQFEIPEITGTGTLTVTTGPVVANPYAAWATGNEPFTGDANGDGVTDGLAWFLGASGPSANALNKMPAVSTPTGYLQLDFARANPYSPAKLYLEYGNDLIGWTKVEIPVLADGPNTIGGDISVNKTSGTPVDLLEVKIPTSTHAVGGKLFTRLSATQN